MSRFADGLILGVLLLGIGIFILYPIWSVVSTSLYDRGVFTLDHYKGLLRMENWNLIRNSLWVAVASSGLTTLLAFCIALYAFVSGRKRRFLIQRSLLLTMISPPFVSALAFIMLFGRRGLITHSLLGLSVNPYGWQGIVILQTVGNIAFASLMLLTALEAIDVRQILASRDLGASPFKTLLHVILPAARPGILSIAFILFTMNLADFGTPIVMGGRYSVLATEAYLQVISTGNLGKASAISVLMIPAAILAFFFYHKSVKRTTSFSGSGTRALSNSGHELRFFPVFRGVLCTVTILFLAVMLLKYSNILLSTVSNTASGSIQFTAKHLQNLPRSQWSSFWHSIWYSAVAGVVASLMGILLSYYTHRRRIFGMKLMEFCVSLPYIIPGTFFGLGYVAAFTRGPIALRGTAAIIILNYIFRQISVSNKAANAAFSAIDDRQDRAARDLGASHVRIFSSILLPQLLPTFVVCFVTIFTSSMTAVGAIVFLISPGKNVASVELFQSIGNGRYGVGAVQAVCIILATVGINLLTMYLLERFNKNKKEVKDYVFAAR